ncbi:MAG: hypothetical protein NC324_08610 [Bacteroides sp.]|nr:hypothetical protein [Bacteroides sp.]
MRDSTISRYAHLYKRYLDVMGYYRPIAHHLPFSFFVEKAAGKNYAYDTASRIIRQINTNRNLRRDVENFIKYDME